MGGTGEGCAGGDARREAGSVAVGAENARHSGDEHDALPRPSSAGPSASGLRTSAPAAADPEGALATPAPHDQSPLRDVDDERSPRGSTAKAESPPSGVDGLLSTDVGAKRVLAFNDTHVWWTILRWLHKRHPKTPMRELTKRYGWHKPRGRALRWRDGGLTPALQTAARSAALRGSRRGSCLCVNIEGEPGAYRKAHAGFGEGHPKTPAETAGWRRIPTLLCNRLRSWTARSHTTEARRLEQEASSQVHRIEFQLRFNLHGRFRQPSPD
jgi:hypothetical protein